MNMDWDWAVTQLRTGYAVTSPTSLNGSSLILGALDELRILHPGASVSCRAGFDLLWLEAQDWEIVPFTTTEERICF
jgi:hypothetical protein